MMIVGGRERGTGTGFKTGSNTSFALPRSINRNRKVCAFGMEQRAFFVQLQHMFASLITSQTILPVIHSLIPSHCARLLML